MACASEEGLWPSVKNQAQSVCPLNLAASEVFYKKDLCRKWRAQLTANTSVTQETDPVWLCQRCIAAVQPEPSRFHSPLVGAPFICKTRVCVSASAHTHTSLLFRFLSKKKKKTATTQSWLNKAEAELFFKHIYVIWVVLAESSSTIEPPGQQTLTSQAYFLFNS